MQTSIKSMQEDTALSEVGAVLSRTETVLCARTHMTAASQDWSRLNKAPELPHLTTHPKQGSAFPTELSSYTAHHFTKHNQEAIIRPERLTSHCFPLAEVPHLKSRVIKEKIAFASVGNFAAQCKQRSRDPSKLRCITVKLCSPH